MATNVKENGFETLIVDNLVNLNGYLEGKNDQYLREYAVDALQLLTFLEMTQPDKLEGAHLLTDKLEKAKFLQRLSNALSKDGVIKLLREGFRYNQFHFDLFFVRPTPGNDKAAELYAANQFSVTRQLKYSKDNPLLALDLCIFLNGLPIITMELKNTITKQNTSDAVHQYKKDRSPKELLFCFKRCMVHFAVDDNEIMMCTKLDGDRSWFLPFNKGYNDGAGNPPNPLGIKTDYLWREILTKDELSNIIENYAQVIEEKDEETKKTHFKQVFPRYHQLQVVKALLADAKRDGVGQRYLIQHSAGSGKSNSIAWLAHQLVELKDASDHTIFDSIIIVTARVNLDKQIRNTIRQFTQVRSTVGAAYSSEDLRKLLSEGKKIIITIVHKFQFILDTISTNLKDRRFAIIIDEAHSSQNGSLAAKMNMVLSNDGQAEEVEDDIENKINQIIEGRRMVKNASYFAFTATPKNKTLEMFGKRESLVDGSCQPHDEALRIGEADSMRAVGVLAQADSRLASGVLRSNSPRPHYVYTMKQAIEEGFILDVLRYYTPVKSYYKLVQTCQDNPQFDKKKAQALLRSYVETNEYAIAEKAKMIVEHFHTQTANKLGGQARAMVVASSIKRAVEYWTAINRLLKERNSQYRTIIAFSGTTDVAGEPKTEADLNGFATAEIEKTFKKDNYRILVVANKFQTGFDEPLLHTMYVDKQLSDIAAVQTLSRLNRCAPNKVDTFILDFANDPDIIKMAFDRYYKTTILSGETDINKLNDLISTMESVDIYTMDDVSDFVEMYLNNAPRERLDSYLDDAVEVYKSLELEEQIAFKSAAKTFVRTYNFLAAIMPCSSVEWEKLSIYLNLLIGKLPSPDNNKEILALLNDVDLESYRAVALETMRIVLENADGEVNPIPVGTSRGVPVEELDSLSEILKQFHELFGGIEWTDEDRIKKQISELPEQVAQNEQYQNAMAHSDAQNARAECDDATDGVVLDNLTSCMELYKAMQENPALNRWIHEFVFHRTYQPNQTNQQNQPDQPNS